MTDKDSAGTTAELDTLYWQGHRYYRAHEADRALAAVIRERDEARADKEELQAGLWFAENSDQFVGDASVEIARLRAANAQMAAALRSVARWATDEKLTAAERINIIAHQPQVRAASQEVPGHTDLMVAPESIDAFLEANPLPEEAPASPAAEDGESEADYNRRCDDLILSIKAATPASHAPAETEMLRALDRMASGDCEEVNPASPSPGLRETVIEECAKVVEAPGFIQARDTEWDEGVNFAKRFIAAAIRALSHPVSERGQP